MATAAEVHSSPSVGCNAATEQLAAVVVAVAVVAAAGGSGPEAAVGSDPAVPAAKIHFLRSGSAQRAYFAGYLLGFAAGTVITLAFAGSAAGSCSSGPAAVAGAEPWLAAARGWRFAAFRVRGPWRSSGP